MIIRLVNAARRLLRGLNETSSPLPSEQDLRSALDKDPADSSSRSLLVAALLSTSRAEEAEKLGQDAVFRFPDDESTWLCLANILRHQLKFAECKSILERAISRNPASARLWLTYAQLAKDSHDPGILAFSAADDAFHQAAENAGSDFEIQVLAADHFVEARKFAEAVVYYERVIDVIPDSILRMLVARRLARCLRATGRNADGARYSELAFQLCQSLLASSDPSRQKNLLKEVARIQFERDKPVDAARVLNNLKRETAINYGHTEYFLQSAERIRRLRDKLSGKDLVIFCQGPSFANFAERLEELDGTDVVFAALGAFPPIEERLQKALRRPLDYVFITSAETMGYWHKELSEFLAFNPTSMLVTSKHAFSKLPSQGVHAAQFIDDYDEQLIAIYPADGPPTPSNPLHFESGNTLSCMLPFFALGSPRRIFVVGADGGIDPKGKRPYFFYNDVDAPKSDSKTAILSNSSIMSSENGGQMLEQFNMRMRREAAECDELFSLAFFFLQHAFDVRMPDVYNVCPHSSYNYFPKIDEEEAFRLLKFSSRTSLMQPAIQS